MRLLPRRRAKDEKSEQDAPATEEGLAAALGNPDRAIRHAALEAIAARDEPTAVDALMGAVATWPYLEEYAALEQALALLVEHAREGWPEAFAQRLLAPAGPPLDERHQDALAALLRADPRGDVAADRVADDLVRQLAVAGAESETRAARVLTWLGRAAADAVLRALDAEGAGPATVRVAGALGDSRAVEPIVGVLRSADAEMRSAAATALGALNDTRAVQALMGATQDPERAVRGAAAEALNDMGVAAVIVGVASVVHETMREHLAPGRDTSTGESQAPALSSPNSLPAGDAAPPGEPPTWAQEVLGRLLKRIGG